MAAGGKGGAVWSVGLVRVGAGVTAASVLSDGAGVSALGSDEGRVSVGDGVTLEEACALVLDGFGDCELIGLGDDLAVEGEVLAAVHARPVVWDFGAADRQMGGFGAPLDPFFHHALALWMGARGPVVFLETGDVIRLSWVDPRVGTPEAPGACLAFDAGPGMRLSAGDGTPNEAVLERMLGQGHFARMPPKRLHTQEFSWIDDVLCAMPQEDAGATMAACVAVSVADAMAHLSHPPGRILVSGPGRRDAGLMAMIAGSVACPVVPIEAAGLSDAALAAQAIAHLAVRVARGLPTTCPGTTGVAAAVGGGQIARPQG